MNQPVRKVWMFRSDSNPEHLYQTLQYPDETTSCNCPGWCRRIAADGSRACKHTRLVDLGQADYRCEASHQYGSRPLQPVTLEPINHHAQRQIQPAPRLGHRKFAV